jgi:hypothetical protein
MRGKFGARVSVQDYNSIQSNLNAAFLGGAFLCSLTSGRVLQFFSPRKLFIGSMLGIMVLNIIQTVSPLIGMYISRFCIGYLIIFNLFLGPLMVSHICPSVFVGILGSFFGFFNALGMFISSLIKSELAEKYWFIFFNLPTIFEFLRLIVFCIWFPYESPYHVFNILLRSQTTFNREELRNSFFGDERVHLLVKDIYVRKEMAQQKEYLFMIIEKYHHDRQQLKGVCETAFSVEYRKQFSIGFVLNFARQMTGISVIVLYTKKLYQILEFSDPELLVTIGGTSYKESCT